MMPLHNEASTRAGVMTSQVSVKGKFCGGVCKTKVQSSTLAPFGAAFSACGQFGEIFCAWSMNAPC